MFKSNSSDKVAAKKEEEEIIQMKELGGTKIFSGQNFFHEFPQDPHFSIIIGRKLIKVAKLRSMGDFCPGRETDKLPLGRE